MIAIIDSLGSGVYDTVSMEEAQAAHDAQIAEQSDIIHRAVQEAHEQAQAEKELKASGLKAQTTTPKRRPRYNGLTLAATLAAAYAPPLPSLYEKGNAKHLLPKGNDSDRLSAAEAKRERRRLRNLKHNPG